MVDNSLFCLNVYRPLYRCNFLASAMFSCVCVVGFKMWFVGPRITIWSIIIWLLWLPEVLVSGVQHRRALVVRVEVSTSSTLLVYCTILYFKPWWLMHAHCISFTCEWSSNCSCLRSSDESFHNTKTSIWSFHLIVYSWHHIPLYSPFNYALMIEIT